MNTLTNERLEEIKEMATDAAKIYGSEWLSSLVDGNEGKYNAITSDHTNDIVVRAEDDKRESGWLCDYLEAVSPGVIIPMIDRLLSIEVQLAEAKSAWQKYEDAAKAADAQLAELRGQAVPTWTADSEPKEFGKYYVRYIDDDGRENFTIAKWMRYNFCSGSDTNIHNIWLDDRSRSITNMAGVTHFISLPVFANPVPRAASQPYTVPEDEFLEELEFERSCPDYMVCDMCRSNAHHCGSGTYECQNGHVFFVNRKALSSENNNDSCRAAMVNSPVTPGADQRIADAMELLKQVAPSMLADNHGPDGPLVGKMKPQGVPGGWALVPSTIYLNESNIESICSQCGDGGGNYGDFTRGMLWVGDIQDDEGNVTHGLHISSDDYPEEGGITLAKFSAAPQHKGE